MKGDYHLPLQIGVVRRASKEVRVGKEKLTQQLVTTVVMQSQSRWAISLGGVVSMI
tara:strand:+ start:73 stop:240 length:168 start_codon:yes stop_codon:yes gene_type:complete